MVAFLAMFRIKSGKKKALSMFSLETTVHRLLIIAETHSGTVSGENMKS